MKNLYAKLGVGMSMLPVLAIPFAAGATTTVSTDLANAAADIDEIGTSAGVNTSQTLPQIIGTTISILLGVLGIVFVVLVVYAGFLYLTANGAEDNTKKAKKLLTQAIIGLIIIVSAYAISSYVIGALTTIAA